MFIIRKEFSFSASHCLSGLKESHPCSRTHGHNYVVTVELRKAEIEPLPGFVVDFRELYFIKRDLAVNFDHRHLNDVLDFNPTVELMCSYFYHRWKAKLPSLYAIEISETPKTVARYEK